MEGNQVLYRLTIKRDGSRTVEWPTVPSDATDTKVGAILAVEARHLQAPATQQT